MISIITAIHNQLDMNKLYWESITRCTDNEFELIIIDNGSTDGSREFFESKGERVKLITNKKNYAYAHCQNQGLRIAQYPVLAFLNNDILLPPHWDSRAMEVLGKDNMDVISLASNDSIHNLKTTKRFSRRWKYIKYPIIKTFGVNRFTLKLMFNLFCNWNWKKFTEEIFNTYGLNVSTGFSGHAIIMNRQAIEKLGEWDVTQQDADYNLFYQTCKRHETVGDIKPIAVVDGLFSLHYRRLTRYSKCPPFENGSQLKSLNDNWSSSDMNRWNKMLNFK